MVINLGQAIGGRWAEVAADIEAVTRVTHSGGAIVKVIFENCYLTDAQKVRLCEICGEVGADYVKTSTGYGTGGATHADLILMQGSRLAGPRQAEGSRRCPRFWTQPDRRRRGSGAIGSGPAAPPRSSMP